MCTLALILDQKGKTPPDRIRVLANAAAHRGPDDFGTWSQENLYLGHHRLAIFDPGPAGAQPFHWNHLHLIYNGAIYNFPEIRKELQKRGYRFASQSDTAVIPAAWDCWGPACLHRFNGQFAFVLFDERQQEIYLVRDRFGIKPLYYRADSSSVVVASELQQFETLTNWTGKLNETRWFEWLAWGRHDHTNETLYEDIRSLPPGHYLGYSLSTQKMEIISWYNWPPPKIKWPGSPKEALLQSLTHAVQIRSRADVPLGSCLSGGLDSSTLVSLLKETHTDLSAFSVSFPGSAIDESHWAAQVATFTGSQLHFIPLSTSQLLEELSAMVGQYDEPIPSLSVLAQNHLYQHAASCGYKVMIDGLGADEILGGYEQFFPFLLLESIQANPFLALKTLWNWRNQFSQEGLVRTFRFYSRSAPLPSAFLQTPAENLWKPPKKDSLRSVRTHMIKGLGLPARLHYADRSSMRHAVEARFPFLDHELVELCLSFSASALLGDGQAKGILRDAMAGRLPQAVLKRRDKQGFPTPWENYMDQVLLGKRSSSQVQKLWQRASPHLVPWLTKEGLHFFDHLKKSKARRHYALFWRLLAAGLWLEKRSVNY